MHQSEIVTLWRSKPQEEREAKLEELKKNTYNYKANRSISHTGSFHTIKEKLDFLCEFIDGASIESLLEKYKVTKKELPFFLIPLTRIIEKTEHH